MKILNELVELANKANVAGQGSPEMADFRVTANPDNILAIAEAFRTLEQRAETAEAKLSDLAKQEPVCFIHPEMLYCVSDGSRTCGRVWGESLDEISNEDRLPLFTRPAPAADLVPIGRVDRGEVSDNNEYPNARVVCLHDQADWENFPDGTELFLRPAPAVGMDKPEPYAWLVHAPQGDYVERNPEVVAHLEGTGLTKCKPLYLDL